MAETLYEEIILNEGFGLVMRGLDIVNVPGWIIINTAFARSSIQETTPDRCIGSQKIIDIRISLP